jgi:hypothetical protein
MALKAWGVGLNPPMIAHRRQKRKAAEAVPGLAGLAQPPERIFQHRQQRLIFGLVERREA